MSLNKNKILELIIDVTEFEIEKLKDKHPGGKPPGFKCLLYKRKKVYSDKKKKEGKKERRKEGKKERKKEGKKEGKKERRKEGKKEGNINHSR